MQISLQANLDLLHTVKWVHFTGKKRFPEAKNINYCGWYCPTHRWKINSTDWIFSFSPPQAALLKIQSFNDCLIFIQLEYKSFTYCFAAAAV